MPISIDDQGRVVIEDPQLAEAARRVAAPSQEGAAPSPLRPELRPQLAASNNVVQCGCNLVAGCG